MIAPIIGLVLFTLAIVLILDLSPRRVTDDLLQIITPRQTLHERAKAIRSGKKKKGLYYKLMSMKAALEATGKQKQFALICFASLVLFAVGIFTSILINNLFLLPALSVAFALIPFIYTAKQVVDVLGQSTTYEYTNNNLTATLLPTNIRIENTYDTCHNVTQSEKQYKVYIDEHGSFEWVTFETETYEYDSYGNVKKTTSTAETTEGTVTKTTSATYSSNGNFLASSTDASGNTTKYGYAIDESTLRWIQYPEDVKDNNNIKTYYDYDDMFRLKKTYTTTDQSNNMSAEYTYTNDALTKIETPSTVYSIAYGDFALRTSITAGGKTLATYKYTNDENNNLEELDYGNFDKVKYTYDNLGRVVKEVYTENGTSTVTRTITYAYDNTGALATMVDSKTGITTKYYYDTVGRITAQIETSNSLAHSLRYTYDEHGRVSKMREYSDGSISSASYTYDPLTQYLTKSAQGIVVEDYTYDNFGRIKSKSAKYGSIETLKETITYKSNSDQVTQIALSGPHFNRTYTYNYDKNGNILSVNDGSYTTSYVYDSQNQLIRENNQEAGNTWVWTYDDAGNITSKKEYAYTTGTLGTATDTITYSYGNSTWGDLLTSYDGKTISYDTIGNPLSDGTWTYAWRQGRQLSSMTSGSNQWNFTYDANGMRTERSNKGIIYSYLYNGSQLSRMIYDGIVMKFTYAADGSPISVTYQGGLYYYAVNLQGDVVAIVDKNGALVVEYKYDAWGRLLTTTGSMAPTLGLHNPLRYRGYVYDRETGLYYLQSRYYNPTIGRFINADNYPSTGQGLLGNNMFAYCGNNPISREDDGGEFWNIVIGAAVGAVVSAVTTAIDTYTTTGSIDWGKVGISAAVGAVSGGVAATGLGAIAQAAISAGASAIGSVATDLYARSNASNAGKITWSEMGGIAMRALGSAAIGFGGSVFGTAAGKIVSGGIEAKGATMVFKGKIGAGCWTKAQARNMVSQGKALINTARGLSSVVGTLFTWPTATALSFGLA